MILYIKFFFRELVQISLIDRNINTGNLLSIGCCFIAVYIILIVFAVSQVHSAANAPQSHLGGYSTSDYGWDISTFRNNDFVSQPRSLSGRYENGKNVKTTSM